MTYHRSVMRRDLGRAVTAPATAAARTIPGFDLLPHLQLKAAASPLTPCTHFTITTQLTTSLSRLSEISRPYTFSSHP